MTYPSHAARVTFENRERTFDLLHQYINSAARCSKKVRLQYVSRLNCLFQCVFCYRKYEYFVRRTFVEKSLGFFTFRVGL